MCASGRLVAQPKTAECTQRPRRLGHTSRRRVDGSPRCGAEGHGKREGEGSVRTTKPAPSEYPHATALGKFERRDKTRTFCLRALGRPTQRVGRMGLVIGYKKGVRERDEACGTRSVKRRHRVVCFHCYKSPEQEAKSQQIVGQSLLSCLQYPVPYLSRLQRIYPSQHSKLRWSMMLGRSLS